MMNGVRASVARGRTPYRSRNIKATRFAARTACCLALVAGCHRRTLAGSGDLHSLDASQPFAPTASLPFRLVGPPSVEPIRAREKPPLAITRLRVGTYGSALVVTIDAKRKSIVGKYKNATGDDGHGHSKFTCDFDFRGTDNGAGVIPLEVNSGGERFRGNLRVLSETAIHVKFDVEPGGCWNVDSDIADHIASEGTIFSIGHSQL